ncbi:Hypothetical protein CINCED_3A012039 [Cinara cedri]|uniref:Uncharacterized protein n=1 Tax=Cinara cedri TaxID=506608 RepID=A0A5E4M2G2_9HEMI|nr:Hypothetical protein CINCED_3A012039 [Cinara cedri]
MADSKCFFGLSNVRNGTWLISIINMTICIVLGVISIATIHPDHPRTDYQQNDYYSRNERRMQHMETDFYFFITFFILFLFFYINLHLKKSTYVHATQSINQWLVINTIFFSFYFLFVCFCTLKYGLTDIITFGIPMGVFSAYQIHVVKCFYNDELKFLLSEQNVTQPTINGPQYVAIASQAIPSTYPVQTGPYIIQQVHQPTTQATPYPQQAFQFQPQQQPSHSHLVPHDPNIPQEYNNPPPYSPNYTKPGGSVTK